MIFVGVTYASIKKISYKYLNKYYSSDGLSYLKKDTRIIQKNSIKKPFFPAIFFVNCFGFNRENSYRI